MIYGRSTHAVKPGEWRERLFNPGWIFAFAGAVASVLALSYPHRKLVDQLQRANLDQSLATRYLINVLKTDPGNEELRLILAAKQIQLHQFAEAEQTLDKLNRKEADLLRFQIAQARFQERGGSNPQERTQLEQQLLQLAERPWAPKELSQLAELAFNSRNPQLAERLLQRLRVTANTLPARWFSDEGVKALAQGNYALGAEMAFTAMSRATLPDHRREYLLQGLRILQSGNQPKAALAAAQRYGTEFEHDRAFLMFAARLAQSANDLPAAARYARLLMQIALWEQLESRGRAQLAQVGFYGNRPSILRISEMQTAPTLIPAKFDNSAYTLAYDIFIASGQLADGYRVAYSAVQHLPQDAQWREKLAKVAEWSGHPVEALTQWRWLAEHQGREDAWKSVLRLAPGLFDHAALLSAYQHQAETGHPGPPQIWQRISQEYEALAQPREAMDYFAARYRRTGQPEMLEIEATLAERAGDMDRAIAALRKLTQDRATPSPDLAQRLAALLYTKGQMEDSFAALEQAKSQATPNSESFWRTYAEIARFLQRDDQAIQAYQTLRHKGPLKPEDALNFIDLLDSPTHLSLAAAVADESWKNSHNGILLYRALQLQSRARNFNRIGTLLVEADQYLPEARKNPAYWSAKAQWWDNQRDFIRGRQAWESGLRLAPDSAELRQGLLWDLIRDSRDSAALRYYAQTWYQDGVTDEGLASALMAAFIQLNEPRPALALAHRQWASHRQDYLWLMNYADVLEQVGQQSLALRLRQALWQKRATQIPSLRAKDMATLQATARLALQFGGSAAGQAALRDLLREDRRPLDENSGEETPQDRHDAVNEIVLSWFLSQDNNDQAAAWMLARYADQVTVPPTIRILQARGTASTQQELDMLEKEGAALPIYDRIYAASETGQTPLAQTLAYEGLEKMDTDDELHLQLTESALPNAASARVESTRIQYGSVTENLTEASVHLHPTPKLTLSLFAATGRDQSQDANSLLFQGSIVDSINNSFGDPIANPNDLSFSNFSQRFHSGAVQVAWKDDLGQQTRLRWGQRCEFSCYQEWLAASEWRLNSRLQMEASIGHGQRAFETGTTTFLSYKDPVAANFRYTLSKREYLSLNLESARYFSQTGESLGQGHGADLEAGYRIRTEYPDFTVRLTGSSWHYSPRDNVSLNQLGLPTDFLRRQMSVAPYLAGLSGTVSNTFLQNILVDGGQILPQNYQAYGINFGFGDELRTTYTQAWRPFMDVGLGHNSVVGSTYTWLVGLAGSVVGNDHLSIYLGATKGGTTGDARNMEAGIRYELYFDH